MKRRVFLGGMTSGGVLAIGQALVLNAPGNALAKTPRDAFQATTEPEVLRSLFGTTGADPSDALRIDAPLQAMRGKPVPVKVHCEIDGAEVIAILTRNNPRPLNCVVHLRGADPYYSAYLHLEGSSRVTAYATAGDSLYFAFIDIKLSRGGYGTHLE